MDKTYDVIVVGAGGAGLNVAGLLASRGLSVCLLDRKSDLLSLSFNTLASYLDLKKFGLSNQVIASKISSCTLNSKRFCTIKRGNINIINKRRLHQELLEKCQTAGVDIKTEVTIVSLELSQDKRIALIVDSVGNKYFSKIYVDAAGYAGVLSKKLGLQDEKPNSAIGMEYNVKYLGDPSQAHLFLGQFYKGGYGWIFPIENHRAIIGYGSFDTGIKQNILAKLELMIKEPNVKDLVIKDNEDIGSGIIPITEVKTKLVINNLVCVGDSVSQVNPLVGEGYYFIMESGLIASKYIIDALRKSDLTLLNGYEVEWSNTFLINYNRCKAAQRLLFKISSNDILCDLANLYVKTKLSSTFSAALAGDLSYRNVLLP